MKCQGHEELWGRALGGDRGNKTSGHAAGEQTLPGSQECLIQLLEQAAEEFG